LAVNIYCIITVSVWCILTPLAFSKHYRKVGQSFCGLARSFELDDRPGLCVLCVSVTSVLLNYAFLCGRPNRPHYESCPSIYLSIHPVRASIVKSKLMAKFS